MAGVPVKKELIEWAYNRIDNQEKLHKKYKKLNDWLDGKSTPTIKQLQNFSSDTQTPLGYFFLTEPPVEKLPIPHYRTLEDGEREQLSPNLIETLHIIKRRQDFLREYYEQYVGTTLPFIGAGKGLSAKQLANKIHKLLDIKFDWASKATSYHDALMYLIERCERNRIAVMQNGIVGNNTHRVLSVSEFRGFVLVDDVVPVIFLNAADSKSAQVFTLVHEIAHILVGSSAVIEASPMNRNEENIEKLCNKTAAEMLCPEDYFTRLWNTYYHEGAVYQTLSRIFKVSPIVIGRRALELNQIDMQEFGLFYQEYLKDLKEAAENKKPDGGNFYNNVRVRLGDLFSKAVIFQATTGNIQYSEAYRLTGLNNKTFHSYKERITR